MSPALQSRRRQGNARDSKSLLQSAPSKLRAQQANSVPNDQRFEHYNTLVLPSCRRVKLTKFYA